MTYRKLEQIKKLDEVERIYIFRALTTLDFHRTATAKALGISVRALYDKIARYRRDGWKIPRGGWWKEKETKGDGTEI